MKHQLLLYIALCSSLLLTACKENDDLTSGGDGMAAGNTIRVAGISTDELVATASVTRTTVDEETVTKTDAENISWLVEPLKSGLDITYGLSSNRTGTSRVAILKLLTEGGNIKYSEDGDNKYAEYSFLYRDNSTGEPTEDPAIWHGNGAHFFEGLYIPGEIQYNASADTPETLSDVDAVNLTSDQSGEATTGTLGNYTLLSRYLGMPSNYTINATVGRIKLPFRHRLARVLAYILIDPEMGSDVKIEGYSLTDEKDDPNTSKIRFCNVKVLEGVKASYDDDTKHYVYTPQWTEIRKAIPHFVGERASYNDKTNQVEDEDNFIAYYDVNEKTYTYPDDDQWDVLKTYTYDATTGLTNDGAYKKIVFGKVPVYDLIVRPTYTSLSNVMYDEEDVSNSTARQNLYAATNQIDFEITLNNGLQYSKRFTFDLNANYQTVVYLHISKERVDYNSSGSDLWVETKRDDEYYGVNNQNGNTLSIAGSSWQRAYTNSETNYTVTDGHQYQWDSEDRYAQYVTDALWIEMLRQACEGGKHHGDYFILKNNISIPAAAFPEDFVFTGHLDGQRHTITLTDASYTPAYDAYETYDEASLTKYIKSGDNYVEFTPDANTTYYDNSGNYTEISDMDAYASSVAYTRAVGSIVYNLVENAWTLTTGTYYQKNGSSFDEISDISTYLSGFNNHIYTRTTNPDSYTEVTNPTGNPKEQVWYEISNEVYVLSTDTEVNTEKTYYTKDAVSYTYTAVADVTTLSSTGTDYYYLDGSTYVEITDINSHIGVYSQQINYNYTAINFYKFVHHESVIGTSSGTPNDGYMFSGLNGKYSTAQETDATATWEANVHKETRYSKTYWVPYKNDTDGWRAEVFNLNVSGGKLFKSDVTYPPTANATVTGYVHNCSDTNGTVTDYTPSIPEY